MEMALYPETHESPVKGNTSHLLKQLNILSSHILRRVSVTLDVSLGAMAETPFQFIGICTGLPSAKRIVCRFG
jgi:hypothetical protein